MKTVYLKITSVRTLIKIPVISKSVGGKLGRKIQFNTETGEVKHKFIQKRIL